MSRSLRELVESSPFASSQAPYLEALYEQYLDSPASLAPAWRQFFERLGVEARRQPRVTPAAHPGFRPAALATAPAAGDTEKQAAVSRLIQFYANRGHLIADIDPLALMSRPVPKVLDPANVGLTDADLDTEFYTGIRSGGVDQQMKLRDILRQLRQVYGGRIGAEFAHVTTSEERLWLQDRFRQGRLQQAFSREERLNLLWQLSVAEGLERYLHTRYVGQKRFSLEGADALIPLLDDVIQRAGGQGVEEIVIGMAHRGRLNVLVNVLGKPPAMLFSEFEGQVDLDELRGSGDVKYHKGFSADLRTPGGNVHVVLAFNPSHLEVVNAVVEGSVRARQDRRGEAARDRVLPLLVHGDAAFAGQGVVMETLQLSQARGFTTGGTLHVIVNNQVGFTTSEPADARSTPYCSDVAKMVEAPIFHVNADDPEAVVSATRLALDYRMTFHKDVVIDLVCYRRHGHNEADEPAATQPLMYQAIRKHPTARQIYGRQLEQDGILDEGQAAQMAEEYRRGLDEGRPQARAFAGTSGNRFTVDWTRHLTADWSEAPATGVAAQRLQALAAALTAVPAGFTLHPRVARIVEDRRRMYADEAPLDWGAAETLAYATLLADGFHVRLCGQDTARGTFFHRHAVWHDQASGRTHLPLAQTAAAGARLDVIDSVLSEEAVLGFEYGYSTTDPEALVIWEGQFGDFANGAQVIIDQFIASGEAKWGRLSGITLFLPHGYEGQGPEHSSARLERFLQLSAELNIQVCAPSTPAQMFHLLRRQMLRALRKPLVVMTPKSLLRHKHSSSTMADLAAGHFHAVIDELDAIDPAGVRRLVLCSGKVYYDLLDRRRADQATDVALVRVEQLYPFPADEFHAVVARYAAARQVVWCQEEPQNQGAWYQIRHRLQAGLLPGQELLYAGREGAAAPATGLHALHLREQENLVAAALYSPDTETTHRETHRLTVASRRKGS
ncbi:MAG: 2-oxoglutarate dehydrogenase E1 component [Steroidobacteraceae bacterium]|nr:2-oxoglutarate dehydrogenase E1 component [Steroidobacteraceae bacterium]